MHNPKQDFDVVIVGGGMAGLTAAAYLSSYGHKPMLLEMQDTVGGLVNSFDYKGFVFDGGIRSIESSGVIKPLIRDLGLDVDYRPCQITFGIKDQVITLSSRHDLPAYEQLLTSFFPDHKKEIHKIVRKIYRILGYMDILYGIENPMMIDLRNNRSYVIKTLLPWLFKFIPTLYQIDRLTVPVESYIRKYTQNDALIDMMIQHFFKATPAFFALGYFGIYFDYHYPQGGTGQLPKALERSIIEHGGMIQSGTKVIEVDPINQTVKDTEGKLYGYDQLIWAADLKSLYRNLKTENMSNHRLKSHIADFSEKLKDKRGAESVLTVYATTDLDPGYFKDIASEHFFYTPKTQGIHQVQLPKSKTMEELEPSLKTFYDHQTYEISIPVLRDPTLAPQGQTGLIISILMDYDTVKHIETHGYYEAFKSLTSSYFIDVLSDSIYTDLRSHIIDTFCSTPLTFEKRNGSTDGAIIGWAYDSKPIPVAHKMSSITSSIKTPIPNIYQAGQWSFSPAGVPISVLTGKLSADKARKKLKRVK